MTLGLLLVLVGLLLMYAGFKGKSPKDLLLGRVSGSATPKPVSREAKPA